MKKLIPILCFILLLLLMLSSCQSNETLNCYVPDGAPSLAMANVVASEKIGTHSVKTYITTGENVIAKCQNGEADLAILPTNAAVTVCTARSEYCFFSVNVLGLLYLVGTEQISHLQQLEGQTVYSIGLGNTPEYVFKKVLDGNSVDYTSNNGVNFEYVTDGSTVIPLVLQGKAKFAVLGEPAVTNLIAKASSQNKTVYRLFDLQQLWQSVTQSQSAGYPQAGLIVKRSLLQNKAFAKALTESVFGNANYLAENFATLNELMQGAGSSLDVNYTAEILQRCNLTAVFAGEIKADIETYLSTFSAMSKFLPLNNSIFYEQNS